MPDVELQQIGPYSITRLLSVSSTTSFYQCKQPAPRKKDVLIKRLNTPLNTPEAKEAFLTRAKKLKKLKNRAIVDVQDANFDGDYGYLVMEYVTGETLRQHIPLGEHLAADEVKRILSPIAGALHYAHVNNTLHCNLHPGNILVGTHHDYLLTEFSLSLPDFSLMLDDEAFAIPYMAPEHLHGQPTAASDQYALAVMAYEWLCGRRPYEATERELLLQQQEQASLPPLHSLNEAVSSTVERVIMQALSYNPQERFPHAQAFADGYLSALMGFPVKVSTGTRPVTPSLPIPSIRNENSDVDTMNQVTTVHSPVVEQFIAPIPSTSNGNGSKNTKKHKLIKPDDTDKVKRIPPNEQAKEDIPQQIPSPRLIALPAQPPAPLSLEDARLQKTIATDLRQGGILSQRLPGYEERPAQIEMATLVAHALTEDVPAIIEAGTGTGKSLAYLVPIVRSGKVAIVSTANKALQEQLFYKDIPFVQKHIKHFDAALVKGVANYLCLDRLEAERTGLQFYAKNRDFQRLVDITNDSHSSFTGDFETLGFQLPADIRSKVATDSDQCAWMKCGFYADCYVRKMREQAERAKIIVVNHTLLLLDAAIGGFLLPKRDVIVIDEAHHLEEEATRSFTVTISPTQITTLLAQRMLKAYSQLNLQAEAEKAAHETWIRLAQVADPGYKGRINLAVPLEEGLHLATAIANLADSLRKQRPVNLEDKEDQLYDKLLKRTENLADDIRTVFSVADTQKFVYYVERISTPGQRGFHLQASAAPLDVTTWLRERLFDKCNVICTSATLATIGPNPAKPEDKGPNFVYFRRRVGLDPIELPDVLESILPLSFDYESNALLYLPRDLPEPTFGSGSDDYMKAIAREMYRLVKLSRGRAFLLFSSKRMLDRAYELMSPHLPYPLLKQGDMTRLEMTRRFREEEGSVLFGLKSFWEGVDIVGDALSLVVIDKLPFDPPDDPVHEARVAQMKAAGENWFGTYVLPQAVLRLKQGLGRLLRTRDDRGVMAILDTRLHTKGYGKMVLNGLPPARRTSSIRDVERFFAE
ncbi:MAG TPA: helicase C-terminal domain-containing protein [Ktedonobacteraceae bacterium]|nr:helicase C-terminal domain-containing protein [Ktedonobacteraceae bacterium]